MAVKKRIVVETQDAETGETFRFYVDDKGNLVAEDNTGSVFLTFTKDDVTDFVQSLVALVS